VLSQTQRFANRWPTRRYRMQPDTVKVSCEQLLCRASGVIDFDSLSEHRRERSVGQATFEIVLQFPDDGGAPKVVSEGGSVVARRIEAAPFLGPLGPSDGRSAMPPDRHRIQ
jgi:hypothetical protein